MWCYMAEGFGFTLLSNLKVSHCEKEQREAAPSMEYSSLVSRGIAVMAAENSQHRCLNGSISLISYSGMAHKWC